MSNKPGALLLVIAVLIAFATAIAHLSCIYFGPQCFSTQMMPLSIAELAENGTLLTPLDTLFVSTVFMVFGSNALSGARVVRKLPLLSLGIYTIAVLCIIRGILPLQLWLRLPDKVSESVLFISIVWLVAGLFYLFGYRAIRLNPSLPYEREGLMNHFSLR